MPNIEKMNIDISLVKRLISAQFPQWAMLSIRPVEYGGWDNRSFHLGEHRVIRMPSAAEYALQVEKEHDWLPKLAPFLPLPIPVPLAMGKPGEEYPWHWSVYQWLDGETASIENIADLSGFAIALAKFLTVLQQCETSNAPIAGPHNFYRGGSLANYDAQTREAIVTLGSKIDVDAATAVWDLALASAWDNAPVWVHGDITIGNLLVKKGQLSAVIDFGLLAIGDPACDLVITWTLFKGESRDAFRTALKLDDATWARARGWTLWKALIVYAKLTTTDPIGFENAKQIIDEVLADYARDQTKREERG